MHGSSILGAAFNLGKLGLACQSQSFCLDMMRLMRNWIDGRVGLVCNLWWDVWACGHAA